ncbi:MMPL family transporter [bacterium]|nr:MMPL family transporter [bacterium]
MRERFLKQFAGWHAAHPWRMAAVALVITLVFAGFASKLTVSMRWSDLLPGNDPRTIQYNKIIDEFTTATSIVIVVQGEEMQIKHFADALAPQLLALKDTSQNQNMQKQIAKLRSKNASTEEIVQLQDRINKSLIRRVDYKREIEFLKDHGLRLIKADDLRNIQDVFSDPNLSGLLFNLNNAMEREYTQREESLSSREKEDGAVGFLDGISGMVALLQSAADGEVISNGMIDAAIDRLLIGEPYFLSYDRKALILNAVPTFSVVDARLMVEGTNAVQALLDNTLKSFPDVEAGLTGMIPLGRDEMVYAEQSLGATTGIAVIAILILLIIAFRMWIAPLLAIGSLLIGIIWAVGLTALLVGQLNIMTQMMAVILLGLGIDFSVHLISGFTERRALGDSIEASLQHTFVTNGKGIITGGVTTAFAFLTLIISSSRGMKEMGIVTGLGLLAILAATFLVLPVFLVFRERAVDRRLAKGLKVVQHRDLSFGFMGCIGEGLAKRKWLTLGIAIGLTLFMAWQASQITFDQNYLNMEPKGLKSVTLNDTILDKFDLSMDYGLILTDSPAQSRSLAKEARRLGSVAMVEDIGAYLPSMEEQIRRGEIIRSIKTCIEKTEIRRYFSQANLKVLQTEVERLEMNIIEMQDMAFMGMQTKVENKCAELVGDPDQPEIANIFALLKSTLEQREAQSRLADLHRQLAPRYHAAVMRLTQPGTLAITDLPESVLDRYANRDRSQFLMTVYPSSSIWIDLSFMQRFTADMEGITPHVTGMPSIFHALIQVIGKDGRNALLLTVVVVFFLLWADFRNPRHALLAMIPLAAGAVWMVGLMRLFGLQFTVINVMGLPMIIGIGIDDGVHIVHRWVAEGRSNLRLVFASTGKAILLTSLTTMLGFGSLVFSIWRGFGSLGGALFLGVAACFMTTTLFLAALLSQRNGK